MHQHPSFVTNHGADGNSSRGEGNCNIICRSHAHHRKKHAFVILINLGPGANIALWAESDGTHSHIMTDLVKGSVEAEKWAWHALPHCQKKGYRGVRQEGLEDWRTIGEDVVVLGQSIYSWLCKFFDIIKVSHVQETLIWSMVRSCPRWKHRQRTWNFWTHPPQALSHSSFRDTMAQVVQLSSGLQHHWCQNAISALWGQVW